MKHVNTFNDTFYAIIFLCRSIRLNVYVIDEAFQFDCSTYKHTEVIFI